MKGTILLNELSDNSRHYEMAKRVAEKAYTDVKNEEISIRAQIAAIGCKLAQIQISSGVIDHQEIAEELRLRLSEESKLRDRLKLTELEISGSLRLHRKVTEELHAESAIAQRLLVNDVQYQAALKVLEQAELEWSAVATDIEDLEGECKVKSGAYHSDTYHRYLVASGFGTDRYRGNAIVSRFDRLLADAINFEANVRNEALLQVMSQAVATRKEQYMARIQSCQDNVATAKQNSETGTRLQELRKRIALQEDVIQCSKIRANDLQAKLDEYRDNKDPRYARAVSLMSQVLDQLDIDALMSAASATETQEDDALVVQLAELRNRRSLLTAQLPELQEKIVVTDDQYGRAKDLERRARSSDYSANDVMYGSGLDLDALVIGYMAGRSSIDSVFNQVESHRRVDTRSYGSTSYDTPVSSRNSDDNVFSLSDSIGSGSSSDFSTSDSF